MQNFPGATQPSQQSQKIEDLGNVFLRADINDNWQGLSSRYLYAFQLQRQQQSFIQGPIDSREDTTEHVTSPPMSSFSEMLKDGNELEAGLVLGSLPKDSILLPMATPGFEVGAANESQSAQDARDLVNFSLGQQNPLPPLNVPDSTTLQQTTQIGAGTYPTQPTTPCPAMWSSDDDDVTIAGGCSSQGTTFYQDDRSFRKKSREKMRRKEVNTEFELLVDLLGFSNRVRKKAILHEAASTIKSLKRECNHLRQDRDLLQQELAKLAAHLDSSQLEPVATCTSTVEDVEHRSDMNFSMEPYHCEHMQGQPECRQYPRIC
ncbi:hypothetical protein PF008_g20691 [Phytophthora fragariae]|uniref:BHLH domain-containing protein n=1 Tax=Phytophthora fragariae TaxID=53985 RepID=A0A6G0QZY2_9STRA|nr:hypothetical protein PF008_g20691 [Phytophthora fragariae]